jgi:hypothetical protein
LLRLTYSPYDEERPYWSEDGEWIAFTAYRDQAYRPYRVRPDGSGEERLNLTPVFFRPEAWGPIVDLDWQPALPVGVGGGLLILLVGEVMYWRRKSRPAYA